MAYIIYFPPNFEISPIFFWSKIHQKQDIEKIEFYESILWEILANNDS